MVSVIKFPVDSIQEHLPFPIDAFICCSSYEGRCRTIPDRLDISRVSSAIIVENMNLAAHVGENATYLLEKFKNKAVRIETDSRKPVLTADNLYEGLSKTFQTEPANILIDVTTFRHESLLILLHCLKAFQRQSDTITIVYSTASDYSVGSQTAQKWLSKGVTDVRTVLGYAGDISPSRKMHLILLAGFEYQRASELIEILEPNALPSVPI